MIPPLLYTFVGTATAVSYHLGQSAQAPEGSAIAASAQLQEAAQSLMAACGSDASDEHFKSVFADQASTVMAAVETLRSSSSAAGLNDTLNSLLEYFYATADSVMGGGGDPVPLPGGSSSSSSSSGSIGSR